MIDVTEAQLEEVRKYDVAYLAARYRMSDLRFAAASRTLLDLPYRESYLDVSCGRGEMLGLAREHAFKLVRGTEVVGALLNEHVIRAVAWDLPFDDASFEVVSLLDVIEHVLPGDDERVCRELARVASKVILLTANNRPSVHEGLELHVNRRPYEQWHMLFEEWFPGRVTWLKHRAAKFSEMWRIDLAPLEC